MNKRNFAFAEFCFCFCFYSLIVALKSADLLRVRVKIVNKTINRKKNNQRHKMFWRQFVRYKSSSISLEKLSEEVRSEIGKIRTRIQIIESESECKVITDKLNEDEQPIAVDLEAVQKSPGLVQVADFQDNIYLFRTGLNQNLFQKGGLKSLLQNPKVTKVMHAATIDCLSLHKN